MSSPESRPDSSKEFVLPEYVRQTAEFLEEIVNRLMEDEYRKDAEFRLNLVQSELGDVAKYLTHDPQLNPPARPHGTLEDEKLAYGEFLTMIFTLMHARGVQIAEALKLGLQNWIERDWKRKEGQKAGDILGQVAFAGRVEGTAFVVSEENPLEQFPGEQVLVIPMFKPDMTHLVLAKKPSAIITDQGGITSHGAIIAREHRIPAVVGCGNATERIPHGATILVDAQERNGRIKFLKEDVENGS